jgi:UDP-glucose:(heptosyl)LPS alpha-1,3-glucosyltransferase
MKIAFCLFKYFPYGGLQRDFVRIAKACRERGHEIHVFTMGWEGDPVSGMRLHLIDAQGWQNHKKIDSYIKQLKPMLDKGGFDLVIGFNKMPHLDIYYAADVCYQARAREKHGFLYRMTSRYKQYVSLESAVFAKGLNTKIMLISPLQQAVFSEFYETEPERFHLLPPGIAKDRIAPSDSAQIRGKMRHAHHLTYNESVLLMVGSGFKTKGVDRAIRGVASLPVMLKNHTRLFVIGQDDPSPFIKLAKNLRVDKQVTFLGGRDDVPAWLLAADFLVHPAYHENTGTVLLEALTSGLPVLTVEKCGYAHFIREANAGIVLREPFSQLEFNESLQKMLLFPQRDIWQENALLFSKSADIYSLPEKAAVLIEAAGRERVPA